MSLLSDWEGNRSFLGREKSLILEDLDRAPASMPGSGGEDRAEMWKESFIYIQG